MQKIKLEDRIIYRPSKGKKVKFIDSENTYNEIVISQESDKIIEVAKGD